MTSDDVRLVMPSGATYEVTSFDAEYVQRLIDRYQVDFDFSSISDLQDLDRVIQAEHLLFKWNQDLARGTSANGQKVDEVELRRRVKEQSGELRQLKKNIGIDRVTRDRQRGDGSLPDYMDKLRRRALRFGIHRNAQQAKAIELANQAIALVTLHDQCTPEERRRFRCEEKDLMQWFRDVFTTEFQALDADFRAREQAIWIADM